MMSVAQWSSPIIRAAATPVAAIKVTAQARTSGTPPP
jgi:hypothetical protein